MFREEEIKLILKDFPKFELCYEMMTHKKVLSPSVMLAIPEGKKCFAWFTVYKSENVCFILEINDKKNIVDLQIVSSSFIEKLALGTIFFGTYFNNKSINYFCIEDIYYYAGKQYKNYSYFKKLEKISEIFKYEILQSCLNNKHTIFGLPLILDDLNLLLKEIQLLPYNVSEIKFRFLENENSKKIVVMKYYKPGSKKQEINNNNKHRDVIFKITADIEPDIYNLFVDKNGVEEYFDTALIPDYKTSVMMNKLFRNIKENDNLDAIEESDEEEEFEDNREEKYVYLDRSFKIKCEYNSKFKRWMPVSLAGDSERIISYNLLK
jgi:hypothetical protein